MYSVLLTLLWHWVYSMWLIAGVCVCVCVCVPGDVWSTEFDVLPWRHTWKTWKFMYDDNDCGRLVLTLSRPRSLLLLFDCLGCWQLLLVNGSRIWMLFWFWNFCTAGKRMNYATQPIRQYPTHLRYVATLSWEIENSNILPIFSRCGRKCKQIAYLLPLTLLYIHKFWYFQCLR